MNTAQQAQHGYKQLSTYMLSCLYIGLMLLSALNIHVFAVENNNSQKPIQTNTQANIQANTLTEFDPQRIHFQCAYFQLFAAHHEKPSHLQGDVRCAYDGIHWQAHAVKFRSRIVDGLTQAIVDTAVFSSDPALSSSPTISPAKSKVQQAVIFDSRAAEIPHFNILFLIRAQRMQIDLSVEKDFLYYDVQMKNVQQAEGRLRRSIGSGVRVENADNQQPTTTSSWYQCRMQAADIRATLALSRVQSKLYNPLLRSCMLSALREFCLFDQASGQHIDAHGVTLECQFDDAGILTSLHIKGVAGQPAKLTITEGGIERRYRARDLRLELSNGDVKSIYTSNDSVLSERAVSGPIAACLESAIE